MRWPRVSPRRLSALAVALLLVGLAAWYVRETQRALDDLRQQQRASCVAFASVGRPQLLTARSGELAREIVTTHAQAARALGCQR